MRCKQSMMTRTLLIGLALLVLLLALPVAAQEVTITAEYRGGGNQFINTTPQAAFCRQWSHYCNGVETVGIPLTYDKKTTHSAPDHRDLFYIKVPGRRTVTVTHELTGEAYQLTFEIFAVSQHVVTPNNNPVFTRYIRGGCGYLYTLGGGNWASYLWSVKDPANPEYCYPTGSPGSPGMVRDVTIGDFGVAYRLETPSPLRMKQGMYRGQATYQVGPGADFDFGNDVSNLNSNTLTINFELDVVHAFVIDFPAGSERVVLEPPGGWTQWLNNKRVPERLYRDLPLRIWSSGPFTVHTRCEYPLGGQCAIRNGTNDHQVPVQVALTLPSVILHNGQPVSRLPLPVGEATAIQMDATQPAINRGGSLHFQVDKSAVSEMTRYPGARYEGDVTVVFDADF